MTVLWAEECGVDKVLRKGAVRTVESKKEEMDRKIRPPQEEVRQKNSK